MLRFETSLFAAIGVIASAVPIVIHLLNRRRFKTVPWAAMDFLREALQSRRKTWRIRDALLLAARMMALVLIGLVLAKPTLTAATTGAFWPFLLTGFCVVLTLGFAVAWATRPNKGSRGLAIGLGFGLLATASSLLTNISHSSFGADAAPKTKNPLHAILIVDNSRSLGVTSFGGTLLDLAKAKAAEFIDRLPFNSRISVIPLAGSETPMALEASRNKDDSRRVLDRIKLVDVAGSVLTGFEQAERECQQTVDPAPKHVVLLTDLQANAWSGITDEWPRRLSELQIVNVAHGVPRNVWLTGLHVEDGLATSEVPCRILARIHSTDLHPNANPSLHAFEVQARLMIDGIQVSSQTIALTSGQEREIEFTYQFEQRADPRQSNSAVATVVLQSDVPSMDQLPDDNRQQIVVPVVSMLPIVFVDQYGDDENLERNKIGETYALRHLMAPRSNTNHAQGRLIQVEHLRGEQLTQERLQAARLVVVAGIEKPDAAFVALLREFVCQGGPLVILAGGQFDPAAWTASAWLAGRGILPAPLASNSLGQLPDEVTEQLQPFFAAFSSMQHEFFQIEGEDPKSLASLFESTPFFKAVQVDLTTTMLEELLHLETQRFAEERQFVEDYLKDRTNLHESSDSTRNRNEQTRNDEDKKYRRLEPSWWQWRSPLPLVDRSVEPGELALQGQPRILARYDIHQLPFVVERRLGAGRVVFFSSGVTSNWNLLRGSGAMYLFHRTLCQLMEQTLPARNFMAGEKIVLPVENGPDTRYVVTGPSGVRESLPVDFLSPTVSGITLARPVQAGTYVVSAEATDTTSPTSKSSPFEPITFAVNGAESESDLAPISAADLLQKLGTSDHVLLNAEETIRMASDTHGTWQLWKPSGWCLLVCLLLEQAILVSPLVMGKIQKWRSQ